MNPWASGALAWMCASAIAAPVIGRFLATRPPARAAGPPPAPVSPGTGAAPPPHAGAAEAPRSAPVPGLTPHEAAALDRYARLAGVAILPGHAHAAREIADGLRQRFPATDDTTLGVIAMDLRGYAVALSLGIPGTAHALQAIIDCLGLAAEDLTRLERTREVPFDARD